MDIKVELSGHLTRDHFGLRLTVQNGEVGRGLDTED